MVVIIATLNRSFSCIVCKRQQFPSVLIPIHIYRVDSCNISLCKKKKKTFRNYYLDDRMCHLFYANNHSKVKTVNNPCRKYQFHIKSARQKYIISLEQIREEICYRLSFAGEDHVWVPNGLTVHLGDLFVVVKVCVESWIEEWDAGNCHRFSRHSSGFKLNFSFSKSSRLPKA